MTYLLYPRGNRKGRISAPSNPATSNGDGAIATKPVMIPCPLSNEQRLASEKRLNELPAIVHLGAYFDLGEPDVVRVRIDELREFHLGGMGVAAVNGAVIAAILDCAIGAAGIIHFAGTRAGTVNLSVNFLKPVFGRNITASCWVTRRTSTLLFTEVNVLNSAGRVCVTGAGMVSRAFTKSTE